MLLRLFGSIKVAFNRALRLLHSCSLLYLSFYVTVAATILSAHQKLSIMLYVECKLVFVMFGKWRYTADEITGLDRLSIQAYCLIAYSHCPLHTSATTHSNHVTLWVSVIILWLVLIGNGMHLCIIASHSQSWLLLHVLQLYCCGYFLLNLAVMVEQPE